MMNNHNVVAMSINECLPIIEFDDEDDDSGYDPDMPDLLPRCDSDCKSANCHMSGKPKEERDAASLFIKEEALSIAISSNEVKGKKKYTDKNHYSLFLHCTYISYFIQLFYIMYINHIDL